MSQTPLLDAALTKTAADVPQPAAKPAWYDKSLWGGEDKPFAQREAMTDPKERVQAAIKGGVQLAKPPVTDADFAAANTELGKLPAEETKGIDLTKDRSMVANYLDAMKRGHTGAVVGTGAAALLGGVLAYNMLKKKRRVMA